jgi:hypothetical protein
VPLDRGPSPLAVKVDNYPAARPQTGLDHADVVFEEPVEGGVTRFVAVFQCEAPPLIGPIRSARMIDVGILEQLSDPLFVHVGGIAPILSALDAADRNGALVDEDLFYDGSVVQHRFGRVAPYSTYVSARSIWRLDPSDTTPPRPLFTYSAAAPAGPAATRISIPFSVYSPVVWHFDAARGVYLLDYGSSPARLTSGRQISTANVVVEKVRVFYGPWVENSEGALEVQAVLTGSGPAMVFRDGVELKGSWERGSLLDPTRFLAADGAPIPLAPGRTFVELVPDSVPVAASAPGGPAAGPATSG